MRRLYIEKFRIVGAARFDGPQADHGHGAKLPFPFHELCAGFRVALRSGRLVGLILLAGPLAGKN
jgi:hypothetical protein